MPQRAPRICPHPGCKTLTLGGRCEAHAIHEDPAEVRKRQTRRGLPTNSARWRRIREKQLKAQPLCQACLADGRMTPAKHVDHINGNSYNNQDDNLQSLCISCHSRKTAREDGGFGNEGRGG